MKMMTWHYPKGQKSAPSCHHRQKGRLGHVDLVCFRLSCFVAASWVFRALRSITGSLVLKYWASGDWCCTMWPSSWSISACVTSQWNDVDGNCPHFTEWLTSPSLPLLSDVVTKLELLLKLLEVFSVEQRTSLFIDLLSLIMVTRTNGTQSV